MFLTGHRKNMDLRRIMTCVCCAAFMLLMPVSASAERKPERSGFTGAVLLLTPQEERGKKRKKQLDAKLAESRLPDKSERQARLLVEAAESQLVFKIDPERRVIIEPAAVVSGVDVVDGVEVPKDLKETETSGIPADPENVPGDLVETQPDPLEGFNRVMFGINEVVDRVVLEPTARAYRAVIPRPVRRGVSNVLANLATPVTLTNDILQANPDAAANTFKRFMVNSTLGIGGIFDHATGLGVPAHREDFGQTLGTWGIKGSPYIVLPLLGPSNPRDMVGIVADTAVNPMTWVLYDAPVWQRSIPMGAEMTSGREGILDDYDNLRKNSPDLYASVRDLYAQKRQAEIANEAAGYNPGSGASSLPPASIPQTLNPY